MSRMNIFEYAWLLIQFQIQTNNKQQNKSVSTNSVWFLKKNGALHEGGVFHFFLKNF